MRMAKGKIVFHTLLLLSAGLVLFSSPWAQATRVANFSVAGQNILLGNTLPGSSTPSYCAISITNNSPSPIKQVVTMEVVIVEDKPSLTTTTNSSTFTLTSTGVVGTDCTAASSACTKEY